MKYFEKHRQTRCNVATSHLPSFCCGELDMERCAVRGNAPDARVARCNCLTPGQISTPPDCSRLVLLGFQLGQGTSSWMEGHIIRQSSAAQHWRLMALGVELPSSLKACRLRTCGIDQKPALSLWLAACLHRS